MEQTYAIAEGHLVTPRYSEDDRGFFSRSWECAQFCCGLGRQRRSGHSSCRQPLPVEPGVLRGLQY